jgi:hypothetical protein
VQYSPRYRLAFTLLNEDAAAGQALVSWDAAGAIARELFPSFLWSVVDQISLLIRSHLPNPHQALFTPQLYG